ncbi:hypothetical protein AAZX31_01G021600 [Glycine max]
MTEGEGAHALIFPCPLQGHVGSMLKLSENPTLRSIIHFRTSNACCFWPYFWIPKLFECKELPIRWSVIYVSFGSSTVLTREELVEFWHGLVNRKNRFLWVMRPDLVVGKENGDWIPAELEEGTKERGFMVGWAPQEEVNSRFVSEVWKLGLDMKDVCDRKVVEKMINDLMVHRKEEFLKSAQEMAMLAHKSISPGGSSYSSLDDLIQYIKSACLENS